MEARPTIYRGIGMRSRLEATFAQWLDAMDVAWQYEGVAFADETGQYLPDFTLADVGCSFGGFHHWRTVIVDVKPSGDTAAETLTRMRRVWSSTPSAVLAVLWPKSDWRPPAVAPWEGLVFESHDREPFKLFYGVDPDCDHFTIGDGITDECPVCFLDAKRSPP